jgi:hypothetical protein
MTSQPWRGWRMPVRSEANSQAEATDNGFRAPGTPVGLRATL